MNIRLRAVTFGAAEPQSLAIFWSAVTGREVIDSDPDLARVESEIPGGPALLFLRVPESKTVKDRIHLDLETEDRAAEVSRVIALGATFHSEVKGSTHEWTVLQDPEGNEFCIIQSLANDPG